MLDRRHDSISSDWLLKQLYTRAVKPRAIEVLLILLVIVFLVLFWDRLPLPWKASATAQTAAIQVWVDKRFGLYDCPGSKLYGKLKPGFFVPQGKALEAGYLPRFNETCK